MNVAALRLLKFSAKSSFSISKAWARTDSGFNLEYFKILRKELNIADAAVCSGLLYPSPPLDIDAEILFSAILVHVRSISSGLLVHIAFLMIFQISFRVELLGGKTRYA